MDIDNQEIEEAVEGWQKTPEGKDENNLPEAPASATVRFWIDGYGVLFTMRDEKVAGVRDKLEVILQYAKQKGWKPSWKEDEKPAIKRVCDVCGADAEQREGITKTGKKWAGIFCSENKNHVKWLNV